MTKLEHLLQLLQQHGSFAEAMKALGLKWNSKQYDVYKQVFYKARRAGKLSYVGQATTPAGQPPVEPKPIEERVSFDIQKAQESAKVREYREKYSFVLKKLEESEKRFDALLNIKEAVDIIEVEQVVSQGKHEACPVIMLSDWHFEERVDSQNINGLNHYDLDIAQKRWHTCIQNSAKLIHRERQSSEIKQVIVWLGGDFITGYIHEELEESNYLSPVQAVRFAKAQIITALKFYAEYGKFDKIIVVCNYGNHGRTQKKPRVSTSYKNSYEWMMYKDIQDYFSANKKFEFVVPDGLFAYVSIYGFTNRFWHGDTSVALYIRRSRMSETVPRVSFAGFQIQFPLSLRSHGGLRYLGLRGTNQWSYSAESKILEKDNRLTTGYGVIPRPGESLSQWLNRDRLGQTYLNSQLQRMREAYWSNEGGE
ncbi:MAG: hypothetical protein EBW47_01910 [Betaproteobacteria bacterium]|nr:hypothetical protein [Betaproteobacteria bacterium]